MTMYSSNRTLLALVVAAVGMLAWCGCGNQAPAHPNLVIILVDTLRADHLHYHGHHRETSPRIDDLAARSTAFMNHQSTSSRTGPSTASIFTGLFPRSHGVLNPLTKFDAKGMLTDDQTTLAEILTDGGYDCFGYTANLNVSARFGFSQGYVDYQHIKSSKAAEVRDHALRVLSEPRAKPLFLYLHYMEPHSHYSAPEEYRSLFVDPKYDGPMNGRHHQLNQIVEGTLQLSEADAEHLSCLYDQEIRYTDDEVGLILDALVENGLAENTIVVFIADHGEEFLDHGSALHGYTLYQEQLHVPLIVYDPRRSDSRRIEAITRHVDVLPTLLELLGIDGDDGVQGESLVSLMDGRDDQRGEVPALAEASLMAVKTVRQRSLLLGDWKLIEHLIPAALPELYNLRHDPGEQHDLMADEPHEAQRLRVRLADLLESLPEAKGAVTKLSKEEVRKLRSLGYVK